MAWTALLQVDFHTCTEAASITIRLHGHVSQLDLEEKVLKSAPDSCGIHVHGAPSPTSKPTQKTSRGSFTDGIASHFRRVLSAPSHENSRCGTILLIPLTSKDYLILLLKPRDLPRLHS